MIKSKVGTFDVLFSGNLIIERNKSFEFILPDSEQDLRIICFLIEDKERKNYTIETRIVNSHTLELDLINFDHKQFGGGGLTRPVKLGDKDNRALYFSFYLSTATPDVMPVFYYTFYLGEEENNG